MLIFIYYLLFLLFLFLPALYWCFGSTGMLSLKMGPRVEKKKTALCCFCVDRHNKQSHIPSISNPVLHLAGQFGSLLEALSCMLTQCQQGKISAMVLQRQFIIRLEWDICQFPKNSEMNCGVGKTVHKRNAFKAPVNLPRSADLAHRLDRATCRETLSHIPDLRGTRSSGSDIMVRWMEA